MPILNTHQPVAYLISCVMLIKQEELNLNQAIFHVGNPTTGIAIDKDGKQYLPYQNFINHLEERGYALSTIEAYGGHVLRFVNYIYRACDISEGELTVAIWRYIIKSYTQYLLYGVSSENEIAKQIAKEQKKSRNTDFYSLPPIDAAISYFVRLGELEQSTVEDKDVFSMFPIKTIQINSFEKHNRSQASLIGGVISSNLQSSERSRLGILTYKRDNKTKKLSISRSFPREKIPKLIDSANNYRDKALYAFLAASGCRTHEALQITLDDIDTRNREVFLRNPTRTKLKESGLTLQEYKSLKWKGRATETTFLIEPFKSLFFSNLVKYLKTERNNEVGHRFLFQNLKTDRPYFAACRSSRLKQFKKSATKAGISDLIGISPHSLRHSYGFYTLNYLPLPDKTLGLPMPWVKILLGHASIKSTEIYARHDEDLIKIKIAQANQSKFVKENLTLNEFKELYHKSELKKLEIAIQEAGE
jgi:integrase